MNDIKEQVSTNWGVFIPSFLVMLFGVICFGYWDKTIAMGLAIAAGALGMAFANLDKFEFFKGAGFEAKMRQVEQNVSESQSLLEEIKRLAEPMLVAQLNQMSWGSKWSGLPEELKQEQLKQIDSIIANLKISSPKLAKAKAQVYFFYAWDVLSELHRRLGDEIYNQYQSNEFKTFFQNSFAKIDPPSTDKIQNYFKETAEQPATNEIMEQRAQLVKEHLSKYQLLQSKWAELNVQIAP